LHRAIQAGQLGRRVKEHNQALERRADELEETVEERTRELRELRSVLESPLKWLIGSSRQLQSVIEQIIQVAKSPLTVVIQGETGTGKELAARSIHYLSVRRSQPFVAIDCGAIPDNLIESELFGHEKGAFTDAHQRKDGKFQIAGSGTVFLDEIGNLPLSIQSKLLRVLQEREVQPLGSTRSNRIEARVIAASNAALAREVEAGRFRRDLYYRLNEFIITLPPLRERDDVIHLANEFVTEATVEFGRPCLEISEAAAEVLRHHPWPGNVRELRNTVRRAVLLAGDVIEPQHLSFLRPTVRETAPPTEHAMVVDRSLREIAEAAAANAERQAICDALHVTKGNKREAARLLRTDYKTLHVKMKQYAILPR
jgi:two-component system nitrogen regulation response regulator GlnG